MSIAPTEWLLASRKVADEADPAVMRAAGHCALDWFGVAIAGALIPLSPLAPTLGFVVPPAGFGVFVAVATVLYLGLVQLAKGLVNSPGAAGKTTDPAGDTGKTA